MGRTIELVNSNDLMCEDQYESSRCRMAKIFIVPSNITEALRLILPFLPVPAKSR